MSQPKRCRCGKRRWWTNDRAKLDGWVRFWGEWVCDYCVTDALHRVRGDLPGGLLVKWVKP
jgi:hypothetical protein